jgi:hypothetical protein
MDAPHGEDENGEDGGRREHHQVEELLEAILIRLGMPVEVHVTIHVVNNEAGPPTSISVVPGPLEPKNQETS